MYIESILIAMEMLLSQVNQLPSLLTVSCSGLVRGWDPATLRRALSWGHFFQKLHHRLQAQPGLRAALRRHLSRAGPLGPGHLRRCPELLTLALLENRALPSAARHRLLCSLLAPAEPEEEEEPFVHLLARRKAASQLLLHSISPVPEGQNGLTVKAQGQLLLLRLREESGEGRNVSACIALLAQLPCGPALYRAVAAALLEPICSMDGVEARAIFVPWLLADQTRLASFCRLLAAPQVALLCRYHSALTAPYLSFLASWGSRLTYDPLHGEWKANGLEEGVMPWHELRERVCCLWQEPGPLASAVQAHLKLLKAQDGDFEVQGLSVWSDLLLDMETTASEKNSIGDFT